jgi:hypothetical protein
VRGHSDERRASTPWACVAVMLLVIIHYWRGCRRFLRGLVHSVRVVYGAGSDDCDPVTSGVLGQEVF